MSDQKVQVILTGDASGLLKALQSSAAGTEAMAKQMESAVGGVATMLEKFAAPIAGFLGVLAGGHFLKEAISETAELGDAMAKGAQKAGVTVEALSGLAHAAKLSDVAFEDLVGGLTKLAKNMQEAVFTPTSKAAAAFKALGIEVQDANGHLRPTDQVLGDVAEKFSTFKDGADKTALAMNLFGKSGAQMIPLLNEGKEGISELTAEAKRLGITMTTEQAEAAERYKDNLERLEAVVTGLKRRIGDELIPTLDELNTTLIEDGPEAVSVLGVAAKGLVTAFKTVGFVIGAVIQTIISLGATAGNALSGVWTGAQWAIAGQFSKAKDAITSGFHDAHLAMQAGDTVIQKDWEAFGLSLNRLWDPNLAQKTPRKKRGEGNAPTPDGKQAKDKKETDNWLANYEALQAAEFEHWKNMEEISMDGLQKQEMQINLAYAKKLETAYQAGASEEELAALNNARLRDIEQARTDWAQKQAAERKKIAEEEAKEARRILEETGTAEQGFFDGLDQYIKRQGSIFQQFARASEQMLQGIENAFSRSIQGILTGQMTFGQAVKAVWTGIMGSISQAIAQIIAKWIVMKIAGAVLTKAELAESGVKTAALLSEGAAGAWAAYGWMPFVGAGLAMAQIALMEASVAAASLGALSTKGVAPEGSTGMTINAEGGYYTRPTVGLFGEKGPELVSPAVKFQDFASNLASNILAQERQAQVYGRQAAGYARAGAGGGLMADPPQVHVTLSNVTILDSSQRGLRQLGNHVLSALQAAGQERGQVLVPGQVFTGGM